MASGGLKDLIKSLNTAFSIPDTSSSDPAEHNVPDRFSLPEDIDKSISAFLKKYNNINDHDSQRLQDGLVSVYEIHVSESPLKAGAFLHVIRLLQPAIIGADRVSKWFTDVALSVLDGVGHTKAEIADAEAFVLEVLEVDVDDETEEERRRVSTHFTDLLLETYLKRTKVLEADFDGSLARDEHIARQLQDVLVNFGCKRPHAFLTALDKLLVKRLQRLPALGLLCAFVRQQPPHLYTVRDTPVIEHIIKCLMIDTSTTAVSLALTSLIMFLPHIPSSVRVHLPRLFLIYSRILCWERDSLPGTSKLNQVTSNDSDESAESGEKGQDLDAWEKLESSFDSAESTAPELIHFFTFLYGLYPLNFTSYVNKPRKYLKSINFPRAENFDLDQIAIRKRSEQFLRIHLLHPNFFNTTLEEELDDDRWQRSEPADVVSECMGLSINNPEDLEQYHLETSGVDVHTHDIPTHILPSNDHHAHRAEPTTTPQRLHSIPGTPSTIGSPITKPHDLHDAHEDTSPTVPHFPHLPQKLIAQSPLLSSVSSQSPRLGPVSRSQMPRSPALRPSSAAEANLAYLQREITLLKSDLTFERYLKQQHLSHIGQLQRRSIKEATGEMEVLNLLKNNRILQARLEQATESYAKLKRETHTERSQSKKWEAELSTKFRTLKEDEKKWIEKEEALTLELKNLRRDCDHLRQLTVSSESRELLARQELQFAGTRLEELADLKKNISDLEATVQAFRLREIEFDRSRDEQDSLKREIQRTELLLTARDASADRANNAFQKHIADLESRLDAARNPISGAIPSPGQFSPHVHVLIDSAVAATSAKYEALKKEHATLRHAYVSLDTRCQSPADALDDAAREPEDTFDTYPLEEMIPSSAPPQTAHIPIRGPKYRSATASSNASGSSSPRDTFNLASTSAPTGSGAMKGLGQKRSLQRGTGNSSPAAGSSGSALPSAYAIGVGDRSGSRRPSTGSGKGSSVAQPSSPSGRRRSDSKTAKKQEEADGSGGKKKKGGLLGLLGRQ